MTAPAAFTAVPCTRIRTGCPAEAATRDIAEEIPVNIVFNELYPYAVMMASPCDLEDFARGFALTERIVMTPDSIRDVSVRPAEDGVELHVRIDGADLSRLMQRGRRAMTGRTGCGICGVDRIEAREHALPQVAADVRVRLGAVRRALDDLAEHQSLNARTHMVHAAAWASQMGRIELVREDVGRHNALDKLIGARLRTGAGFTDGFCVLTSRYSFEMAEKTAIAGMAVVVAISAPTARALRVAAETGQTVLAIARPDGQVLFGGAERIVMD
ncbi:formate dehydrogenase accessory sulfurtransferase FdhD [Tanticharoenia sakaeratensis]|uniref:Sulfur carrier protein FdhD n=1 Tax=Tanticharoenia sakaeratensis NBRC 103193 TaxID=1231623 RepID=A0A0D6MK64_9PROT|nr:formate dehydrogenase accessory sulfurtransferase FdhD [Tanticharoenia sakaeratensis]GAN54064.1 formate dehydrogenase family accessory protein FdhD [Tanticharoenia sakaeratensis NBRC 103193]GBQ23734.1 formate dehydrogenase accessory protein FdhD [Tanticharoenia sakaeratensis NBRC 103193]